ncbi:7a-methyl-1,5-dioxo-octahydro-1H-inden-4-yl [Seminavis robusta]|uniref:7a-methyl-1,5-dioxo-octahydro-1H-inden-4-yl n=1 Tax=Seminavis robusta TaxID=568900 RepID=A0A9N8DDK5_9STRA|nr:7a-methyl-1,5-dioxo-octahydro-1H-inden-4-yl [Seminavis robusta]|eukprot:Sro93_g048390.1 7a-methyl-1,5-dioxo-octahydro-1H-inden-4-yl (610) ;mRNA; r:34648-36477
MRLSDIVHDAACSAITVDSPCAIYQPQQTSEVATCLTFAAAARAMKQHRFFLKRHCHQPHNNRSHHQPVVVAFLAGNSVDFLLSILACTLQPSCLLPVLLNTRWTPVEIAQALDPSDRNDHPTILIVHDAQHASKAQRAAELLRKEAHLVSVITLSLPSISASFRTRLETSNNQHRQAMDKITTKTSQVDEIKDTGKASNNPINDTAVIIFTSGTTTGAKGVLLSHRALIIQSRAKLIPPCSYDKSTKMLATTVPLFHVGGLNSSLAVWMAGGTLIFPASYHNRSGFQPHQVWGSLSISPSASNTLVVVPAMLSAMIETLNSQKTAAVFPHVKLILIGGQSATERLLQLIIPRFPRARIVQTYACTEAASSLTFWQRHDPYNNTKTSLEGGGRRMMDSGQSTSNGTRMAGDCIGRPPAHVELQLVAPSTTGGDEMPQTIAKAFTTGILATRGPHLLSGYWRRPNSPLRDGWFWTNDLGYRDDLGNFYFAGRVADVIRTGGETVLATEVERVLMQHEAIAECAVFALKDYDKFGETVCAALVGCQNNVEQERPKLSEIRQWCGQQGLAGYKRPRRVFWVQQLPRNSSGKLLKRLLVERFGSIQHPARSKL